MRISITLLSYEHGVIRQVVDCVAEVVRRGEVGKFKGLLAGSNTFFVEYMDRFHHGKEERFLFPYVEERSPVERRTIERLLEDHRRARELLARLTRTEGQEGFIDEDGYCAVAQELVNHITKHVSFEEEHFFPGIEDHISLDDDEKLYSEYEAYVKERFDEYFPQNCEDFSFRLQSKVLPAGHFDGVV